MVISWGKFEYIAKIHTDIDCIVFNPGKSLFSHTFIANVFDRQYLSLFKSKINHDLLVDYFYFTKLLDKNILNNIFHNNHKIYNNITELNIIGDFISNSGVLSHAGKVLNFNIKKKNEFLPFHGIDNFILKYMQLIKKLDNLNSIDHDKHKTVFKKCFLIELNNNLCALQSKLELINYLKNFSSLSDCQKIGFCLKYFNNNDLNLIGDILNTKLKFDKFSLLIISHILNKFPVADVYNLYHDFKNHDNKKIIKDSLKLIYDFSLNLIPEFKLLVYVIKINNLINKLLVKHHSYKINGIPIIESDKISISKFCHKLHFDNDFFDIHIYVKRRHHKDAKK